jgi:flavoprotein hydroxylase
MAPGPLAGRLAIQGCVAGTSGDGLLDDVTAGGFTLLATHGDPNDHLDEEQRELLQTLGGRVVSLDSRSDCGVRDLDGRLTAWLEEHEAHAVLVRPDFYVFGSAASPADLSALVDDLRAQLPSPAPACTAT